jgi:hypothetical protein
MSDAMVRTTTETGELGSDRAERTAVAVRRNLAVDP